MDHTAVGQTTHLAAHGAARHARHYFATWSTLASEGLAAVTSLGPCR
jgi:hypothetical protein